MEPCFTGCWWCRSPPVSNPIAGRPPACRLFNPSACRPALQMYSTACSNPDKADAVAALLAAMLAADKWVLTSSWQCLAGALPHHPPVCALRWPAAGASTLHKTSHERRHTLMPGRQYSCRRNGNGRPLRRLLLTRSEKAFDLAPPPGKREVTAAFGCRSRVAIIGSARRTEQWGFFWQQLYTSADPVHRHTAPPPKQSCTSGCPACQPPQA